MRLRRGENLLRRLFYPVLLVTLFFGLTPKDYDFQNHVKQTQAGLEFGKYGIAYTDPVLDLKDAETLSIELNFSPIFTGEKEWRYIVTLYGSNDDSQLVVAQYANHIIVMNGNDYADKHRRKRLVFNKSEFLPQGNTFLIIFDQAGAKAYLNHEHAAKSVGFSPAILSDNGKCRIIFGNSIYAQRPWTGKIKSVAIRRNGRLHASPDRLLVAYRFDGKSPKPVKDLSGHHVALHIPENVIPLKLAVLKYNIDWTHLKGGEIFDLVINLFGFIPFGLVASAKLSKKSAGFNLHHVAIVVLFGFFLSLTIELTQAWLPSRSSDIMDLLLNTSGAMAGAVLFLFIFRVNEVKKIRTHWLFKS